MFEIYLGPILTVQRSLLLIILDLALGKVDLGLIGLIKLIYILEGSIHRIEASLDLIQMLLRQSVNFILIVYFIFHLMITLNHQLQFLYRQHIC